MLLVRKFLFCLTLLPSVIGPLHINLDRTDWDSDDDSDVVVQHDCLHVTAVVNGRRNVHEITSYCMSEWPSKWKKIINHEDQSFTFAELSNQNVTGEQLYIWSAPIDLIERYEWYLSRRSTSNETSIAMEIFYNCTLPRFGPMCQYEFDNYRSDHSSLNSIIDDFYSDGYSPTSVTCYTHLRCNRGPISLCLDWSEICDGHVDCIDNAVDEEDCWQVEVNECEDSEYRCLNGQCISRELLRDGSVDCLDASDDNSNLLSRYSSDDLDESRWPSEDVICSRHSGPFIHFTSSCLHRRKKLSFSAMFHDKPESIKDDCWSAFKCITDILPRSDPKCHELCPDTICQEVIKKTCPPILFVPAVPVLFGHIYFAYTNNDGRYGSYGNHAPRYVCYNDQLCGAFPSNKPWISFNNSTCYRYTDLPLRPHLGPKPIWINTIIEPVYRALYRCNTVRINDRTFLNKLSMYQCFNSSKYISNYRRYDAKPDCDYGDDERSITNNGSCSGLECEMLFHCTLTNQYISKNQVEDGVCHCGRDEYDVCDDENDLSTYTRTHVSFQTICDGFIELRPRMIEGVSHTDETECQHWQCNNTYTRCDGYWNCLNGADEVDCSPSPFIDCSLHHHICVSPQTYRFMCLPLEKANNGEIDCFGATDEPQLCRSNRPLANRNNFLCGNGSYRHCIEGHVLCNGYKHCLHGDDEPFCNVTQNATHFSSEHHRLRQFFSQRLADTSKSELIYFSLYKTPASSEEETNKILSYESTVESIRQDKHYCDHGLDLRVWFDSEKNSTTTVCLCPPSLYGNMCQYQNQRVSLTMQFRAFSDSWRTVFAVIVSLIDDSDERVIHSHKQLTYLPTRDCQIKFNMHLLYANRSKNLTKQYSVHVDFYEKVSLSYRGSVLVPLRFTFLPVHRVAVTINIPHTRHSEDHCSNIPCFHGHCRRYFNERQRTTFCHCDEGWSGRLCDIQYNYTCSPDSLCVGVSADSRPLCVCPVDKFGPRCHLRNTACRFNGNASCQNGGQCIPYEQRTLTDNKFICDCPQGFFGDRCQVVDTEMKVSFHQDITLPQSILVYFIRVIPEGPPENGTVFKTLPINQNSFTIHWPHEFHIAFFEVFDNDEKNYYLVTVQRTYNPSSRIIKTIEPSDRCQYLGEIFNETVAEFDLIRRIKFYHVLCQSSLSCFYDKDHFCLCDDHGQHRVANCFEFNHTIKHDCMGQSNCQNNGQCLHDNPTCPRTSICVCSKCFFGRLCQLSSSGFILSLDAILGYSIWPHVNIPSQSFIVQMSTALTIVMIAAGLINGLLCVITFQNKDTRQLGCGVYLLTSSIVNLATMMFFGLKFWILIVAQMGHITNRSFLYVQCVSLDFFLRICLNTDQWLSACVAMERAMTVSKGVRVDKKKTKRVAKFVIVVLIFLIVGSTVHDPIYRRLVEEDDDDAKRIWCVVSYPISLQTFNSGTNIFHSAAPFVTNFMSAIVLVISSAKQRRTVQAHRPYTEILCAQIRQHNHLLIGPIVLVILAVPRLIISFASGCKKSVGDSWLLLVGYLISFIPSMLTFVLFVLPSQLYKEQFDKTIAHYRSTLMGI